MIGNNSISLQSKLLILLLASSFILMCLLGFQAIYSVSQQREVVKKVLNDYAQLAVDEYSRRIMADIGYRVYFKTLNDWQKEVENGGIVFDQQISNNSVCKNHISRLYFVKVINIDKISTLRCTKISVFEFMTDQIQNFDVTLLKDNPFTLLHTQYNNQSISMVLSRSGNNLYGFLVNRAELIKLLVASRNKSSLLPDVLSGGKSSNKMMSLGMTDHLGQPLIKLETDEVAVASVHKTLLDEYSGIFKQHKITVTLNRNSAGQLIIGGMPEDNLSTIRNIIIIISIIFIISLRQLRKERQLNQLRENFVAEVSHELRTPLTQIRMFTETLLKGRTRSDQEKQHYLKIINRESLRLNHLINNLLKYSEAGSTHIKTLTLQPIQPIVINVVEEFSPIAAEMNVTINMGLNSTCVKTDALSLQRILLNIIDNAVKYGPEDQTIDIIMKKDQHRLQLLISDQGPGIPEGEQQKIWLPYYRLQREHKAAKSGTGIGLYLVKQLTKQIGAKIAMENIAEGGSRFIIEWELE